MAVDNRGVARLPVGKIDRREKVLVPHAPIIWWMKERSTTYWRSTDHGASVEPIIAHIDVMTALPAPHRV